MANKLKVDELRAKLAERGLSTTGLKAVLVERLEEAIAEAEKKEELKSKRKRNRDYSDDDEESNKLIAIGELRGMNVKELREESNKRDLATTGTKKELLERLCNDANNDSNSQVKPGTDGAEDDDTNGFEEEKKEEKIVTATKKGAAVLDQWIPDHIKSQYHVLQRTWSALGGCVLCILGAEAMFADLGHFSVRSIQVKLTWAAYLTNKASLPELQMELKDADALSAFRRLLLGPIYNS